MGKLHFKAFHTIFEVDCSVLIPVLLFSFYGNFSLVMVAFISSIFHEMVHLMTANLLGYSAEKVTLNLFGEVLYVTDKFMKPQHEVMLHLSGPIFNLLVAMLQINDAITIINLSLGLFNLLPFYPLDGGKIVKLYISFFLGYGRGLKISLALAKLFSIFLFICGIYLVQYNVLNGFICLLSINIFLASKEEGKFILYKTMKKFHMDYDKNRREEIVICKNNVKTMEAAETFKPHRCRLFMIIDKNGKFMGKLSEEEVIDGICLHGIYSELGDLLNSKTVDPENGKEHENDRYQKEDRI